MIESDLIRNILLLLLWSIAESIIWPVPIAVILTSMIVLYPQHWWIYGITVTIGSVTGAWIAYILGRMFKNIIMTSEKLEWFRNIVGLNPKKIDEVKKLYDKYGSYAIILAAITPIPYKLVTWVSGIFEYNLKTFILLSIIGRGATFMFMAFGISIFGEAIIDKIKPLKEYLEVGLLVIFILYLIYKLYTIRKNQNI